MCCENCTPDKNKHKNHQKFLLVSNESSKFHFYQEMVTRVIGHKAK